MMPPKETILFPPEQQINRESISCLFTYLGFLPAKIIWKMPTQAPLLPSQYAGLGSSLSKTSNALAE